LVPTISTMGYLASPLRGCAPFRHSFPPLPPWATFCRPSGAALYCDIRFPPLPRWATLCRPPPGLRSIATFVPTASAVGYLVPPLRGCALFRDSFPTASAVGYVLSPLRGCAPLRHSFLPLPRWATLCRPSGASPCFVIRFPPLPRWATFCRPSGAALYFDIRSRHFRGGLRCAAPPGLRSIPTSIPTASAGGYLVSPLRGCALFRHSFPPLPRGATLCRPSGAALHCDIRSHRFCGGLRCVVPPGFRPVS
jgi:hypothetical protein